MPRFQRAEFHRERTHGAAVSEVRPMPAPRGESRATHWRRRWRAWAIALSLLILPSVVYWPTLFQHYGFRDDYSVLREAHEEPGKVVAVCAMQGRPIYGGLLAVSFRALRGIDDLAAVRLVSALLLGLLAVATFHLLRRLKWDVWTAALLGALLVIIPSAQVLVSWAVGWPRAIALLLALGAFAAADKAFRVNRATVPGPWALSLLLLATSALIYPTDTLYYLTLVAAGLWSKRRRTVRQGVEWTVRHLVTLALGLAIAFTSVIVAAGQGWMPLSARVSFEHHLTEKLLWFAREPLQNALAFTVLNHDGGVPLVHRVFALIAVIIAAGLVYGSVVRGVRHVAWTTASVVVLLVGSFGVNLIAADHWPVYRVLLPLTMTGAVVLTLALLNLGGRVAARIALLLLVVPGLWLARRQTWRQIALPQSIELRAIETAADRLATGAYSRVFVLIPRPENRIAAHVSWDEFGSLSTDSDWTPKEMLKLALRERHADGMAAGSAYAITTGHTLPRNARPDLVIDLQHLRE